MIFLLLIFLLPTRKREKSSDIQSTALSDYLQSVGEEKNVVEHFSFENSLVPRYFLWGDYKDGNNGVKIMIKSYTELMLEVSVEL